MSPQEQGDAAAVIDMIEIHVLDVQPVPAWQRRLIEMLFRPGAKLAFRISISQPRRRHARPGPPA